MRRVSICPLKVQTNFKQLCAPFSLLVGPTEQNQNNQNRSGTSISSGKITSSRFDLQVPNLFRSTSICRQMSSKNFAAQILMPGPQLIESDGYRVETHHVTTDDGYILTIFRIGHSTTDEGRRPLKGPILLQHGLISSSDDWLVRRPCHDNLPYLLAENGYDVFLGNFRGCRYSVGHVNFSHEIDSKYWDFGLHEMGLYDVPSLIRQVLKISKTDKLTYIGYSMGATAFFIAMDQWPQLNDKVDQMVSLAPAVHIGQATSPLHGLARALRPKVLQKMLNMMNDGHVIPHKLHLTMQEKLRAKLKKEPRPDSSAAERFDRFVKLFDGHNPGSVTNETIHMITGHCPSDTSTKTLAHFHQLWLVNEFCQFDYGRRRNMEIYNSNRPPSYDLSKVTCPVSILYGLNDKLVDPKDILKTAGQLGNVIECQPVEDQLCNHIDFVYAKNAGDLIYRPCLKYLGL